MQTIESAQPQAAQKQPRRAENVLDRGFRLSSGSPVQDRPLEELLEDLRLDEAKVAEEKLRAELLRDWPETMAGMHFNGVHHVLDVINRVRRDLKAQGYDV